MKAFYGWVYMYYNNKCIDIAPKGFRLDDEIPKNKEAHGSWDLLEEYFNKGYTYGISLEKDRKGFRRFARWEDCLPIAYEKKQKDVDISFCFKYEEAHPSIQQILEYYDGEKAIKYLTERGLTVCPMSGK